MRIGEKRSLMYCAFRCLENLHLVSSLHLSQDLYVVRRLEAMLMVS